MINRKNRRDTNFYSGKNTTIAHKAYEERKRKKKKARPTTPIPPRITKRKGRNKSKLWHRL